MTDKDKPRLCITAALIALFAYAYVQNPSDDIMKGALIAAFAAAYGYWLGSSKGSSDKADQLESRANGPTGNPGDPVHVEEEGPQP